MLPETLFNRKLWDFLLRVDFREAGRVRKAGCRHCGGVLHSANYLRKPRGVPYLLGAKRSDLAFRHSLSRDNLGETQRRSG